jgi:hypothetical protein
VDNRSGPGRKKTIGLLSVKFDIGGERRPARALGFPCIIVAWAHSSDGTWVEDFTDFWPTQVADATLCSDRLFVQKDSDASGPMRSAHWFYVLPLMSVRSPEALRRLVVQPVFALLGNGMPEAAFGNAPEVLRFGEGNAVVELLPE